MSVERIVPTSVTLAQRLDAARLAVHDLDQRIRACPHQWAEDSRRVEKAYVKGFRPDGTAFPPVEFLVVASTCVHCGTRRITQENLNG